MNEHGILGVIICNMHDELLSEITAHRTIGSVPFGGRYRMIDFSLSNMANSGIQDVGVVPSRNYQSLIDHLGSGQEWDMARKNGGLCILPPFGSGGGVYDGRMQAIAGIENFIRKSPADLVVLSDSDVVANIDLAPVLKQHAETSADITLVYKYTDVFPEGRECVTLGFDEHGRLNEVLCKPELFGKQNIYLDIAVIKKSLLEQLISESKSRDEHSFVRFVLNGKASVLNIRGYCFDGWSNKLTGLKNYMDSNLALLRPEVRSSLFPPERPIYTRVRDEVSARYGDSAEVENSLITDGCIIDGKVENSIIFRGARIEKGAVVSCCVLMHNTVVKSGAVLRHVITDKNVVISSDEQLSGSEKYPLYIPKGAEL